MKSYPKPVFVFLLAWVFLLCQGGVLCFHPSISVLLSIWLASVLFLGLVTNKILGPVLTLKPKNQTDKVDDLDAGVETRLESVYAEVISKMYPVVYSLMGSRGQLESNLNKVATYTESSALEIGKRIQVVHTQIQQLIQDSNSIFKYFDQNQAGTNSIVSVTDELSHQVSKMISEFSGLNQNISKANVVASDSGKAITKSAQEMKLLSEGMRRLSLNASIEAARAGTHGAGFSVLAREFRLLSNSATKIALSIGEFSRVLAADLLAVNEQLTHADKLAMEKQALMSRHIKMVAEVSNNSQGEVKIVAERSVLATSVVAESIDGIVSNLQFQDLTRQQIEKTLHQNRRDWGQEFESQTDLEAIITDLNSKTEKSGVEAIAVKISNRKEERGESEIAKHTSTFGDVVLFDELGGAKKMETATAVETTDAESGDVLLF